MFQKTLAIASLVAILSVGCGPTSVTKTGTPPPALEWPPAVEPVEPAQPVVEAQPVEPVISLQIKEIKNLGAIPNNSPVYYPDLHKTYFENPIEFKPQFKNCDKLETCKIVINQEAIKANCGLILYAAGFDDDKGYKNAVETYDDNLFYFAQQQHLKNRRDYFMKNHIVLKAGEYNFSDFVKTNRDHYVVYGSCPKNYKNKEYYKTMFYNIIISQSN